MNVMIPELYDYYDKEQIRSSPLIIPRSHGETVSRR